MEFRVYCLGSRMELHGQCGRLCFARGSNSDSVNRGPLSGSSVKALPCVLVHQQELAVVHRLHQTHNVISTSMLASCVHSKPRRPGTCGIAEKIWQQSSNAEECRFSQCDTTDARLCALLRGQPSASGVHEFGVLRRCILAGCRSTNTLIVVATCRITSRGGACGSSRRAVHRANVRRTQYGS